MYGQGQGAAGWLRRGEGDNGGVSGGGSGGDSVVWERYWRGALCGPPGVLWRGHLAGEGWEMGDGCGAGDVNQSKTFYCVRTFQNVSKPSDAAASGWSKHPHRDSGCARWGATDRSGPTNPATAPGGLDQFSLKTRSSFGIEGRRQTNADRDVQGPELGKNPDTESIPDFRRGSCRLPEGSPAIPRCWSEAGRSGSGSVPTSPGGGSGSGGILTDLGLLNLDRLPRILKSARTTATFHPLGSRPKPEAPPEAPRYC